MASRDFTHPTYQDIYEIYKQIGGTKPLEELTQAEILPLTILWHYQRDEFVSRALGGFKTRPIRKEQDNEQTASED